MSQLMFKNLLDRFVRVLALIKYVNTNFYGSKVV